MSPEKRASVAKPIGRFFAHQPHETAVAPINDHGQSFCDRGMCSAIIAHLSEVQPGPPAREAVEQLREARNCWFCL
jgi:hypothetical protein